MKLSTIATLRAVRRGEGETEGNAGHGCRARSPPIKVGSACCLFLNARCPDRHLSPATAQAVEIADPARVQILHEVNMDGHNSFANGQLKSFIERIERLEQEKAQTAADIKEVYGEAKATGFDTKIMRKIVTMRKKDSAERQEEQAMLDLYMGAIGMQPSLPLEGGDDDQ
jgi:uncharacterized protein (UPF0335 family)